MGLESDIERYQILYKEGVDDILLFSKIKEQILNGNSTKNKLLDFSIIHFNSMYNHPKIFCEKLEKKILENENQEILIVEQRDPVTGDYVLENPLKMPPSFIGIHTKFKFGKLKSKLDYDNSLGNLIIPVEKHIEKTYNSPWKINEEGILINVKNYLNFETEKNPFFIKKNSLLFYFGFDALDFFEKNEKLNYDYVNGLNLLNFEVPSKNLKKYHETLYKEKLNIFWDLKKLENKKILETNLDEIKKINYQIIKELEKAKKLEMDKTPMKVSFRKNYEVNIQEYIIDLLKNLK